MAGLWASNRTAPTVHLTKVAYDLLMGRPVVTPPVGYGYDLMACGLVPDWTDRTLSIQWIGEWGLSQWEQGQLTVLPNCPVCSVAWDEGMESYASRKQAST